MAEALPVSAGRSKRARRLALAMLLSFAGASTTARASAADACLDASDRARALLAKKRLLEARTELHTCAAPACDEAIRVLCEERLGEVSARLPTVIFAAKDPEGHDLTDVRLTIDGSSHAGAALGIEMALDPGPHVFVFEAPSEESVERSFVLVEREKGRREHVVIGRAREPARPAADRGALRAPSEPSPALRTAGWISIAAGAVGLGIGTAFGITAIAKNDEAGCDARNVCDDPRSRRDARTAANISTASILTGVAFVAAGVGLLIVDGRRGARAAVLDLLLRPSRTRFDPGSARRP